MASFMGLLSKLFGTKAERDIKLIQPILKKVIDEYNRVDRLSNDDLRAETVKMKEIIASRIAKKESEKKEYRHKLEDLTISADLKEEYATKVDKLTKEIDQQIEEVLAEVLPTAFAVMKSTARRFKENETIEVRASEFDRNLAVNHDFVEINGDNAIWHNHWTAGGNNIVWDMVHYDVQLIGGIVLHQGKIAEMATGEGKTLVATLPVFLNALAGKGVHVVTVNDYLSKRDSEWMGPLYMFNGLSVDCIDKYDPNREQEKRKAAYRADITFGTNNEFGFDYLRDNMTTEINELVQKKHHYAIVDEVDSVLIDDARTPLIISGAVQKSDDQQQFVDFKPFVEKLYLKQRGEVGAILNEAKKLIADGKKDEGGVKLLRAYKGLPKYTPLIKYLSEPGIKQLLLDTEGLYMRENNKYMHIITDDLLFVIEEKHKSVEFTDKGNDYIASLVNDEKFFILPDVGAEIAEIEKSSLGQNEKRVKKDELIADYALKSERVHTMTQLLKAYTMFEKDVEYVIDNNEIKIVDEQTGRILSGRRYSDGLHQAIEAKEGVKVEAATQTHATITLQNYFRMYHKLAGMTGTAETEAGEFWKIYKLEVVTIPTNKPVRRKDEDDLIYKTKKDKYNAVINKILELRAQGRPVLVGTTSVEESEKYSKILSMRGVKHNVLNAKQHAREALVVAEAGQEGAVTIATNMAGRGTDIKLGPGVEQAGGLAIIGTERHDSRRVDRQLRGRAGRQGDQGSSIFYVSLEDNLMRLFGSDRIAKIVDRMGFEEGEALQHSMLSSAIERAQKKVEENNFGIRKHLLEYDDVMNSQREVVYNRRRNALYGERIDVDLKNMIQDFAYTISAGRGSDFEDFKFEVMREIAVDLTFDATFFAKASDDDLAAAIVKDVKDAIDRKTNSLIGQIFPYVKAVKERFGDKFANVAFQITDGVKPKFPLYVNIERALETQGGEIARAIIKSVTLYTIDEYWKEHIRAMDELKQSVQNASYEQKDPLLIYKFESFELFKTMLENINRDVLSASVRAQLPQREGQESEQAPMSAGQEYRRRNDMSKMSTSRSELSTNGEQSRSHEPVRVEKKVGRNDPCPCGSGKKYKNCCGKNA